MAEPELVWLFTTQRDAIVAELERRTAAIAPGSARRSALRAHVAEFLDEVVRALRYAVADDDELATLSPIVRAHGMTRAQDGYRLDEVVREYCMLGDCIYEQMVGAKLRPPASELRILGNSLAGAIADTVTAYGASRAG